jgi:hypothetical protein
MGGDVSCYGKLPFHREYIRIGLESAGARWVTGWIDRAHAAASAQGARGEPGPLLAFAAPSPERGGMLAGAVRQSSDGQRRHPVTLFLEARPAGLLERWHLVPLAAAETWTALRALLDRPFRDLAELTGTLRAAAGPITLEGAAEQFAATLARAAPGGPWQTLTGRNGEAARHLALNFLTVCRAQTEARSVAEGVAITTSLADGEDDPAGRLARACLWLDLVQAVAPGAPPPTVILAGEGDAWARLWAIYRPAEGADLAALLTGAENATFEELGETWQDLPSGEAATRLEQVVATEPAPVSELHARLRAAR